MSNLAAWYQKKISSYDKQEWEMQVEKWIVPGFLKGPLLASELPSDLIDVDLVRGSSFAKRKPVQGACRTLFVGLERAVMLPLRRGWWASQTSVHTARLLMILWFLQAVNTLLYLLAPADANVDVQSILVPLCLMLGLSVVHAQIVSTSRSHFVSSSRRAKANRPTRRSRAATQANRERSGKRDRYRTDSCEGASAESGATSSRDKTKGQWETRRKLSSSSAVSNSGVNIVDKDGARKRSKCDPPQRDISSIIKRPYKSHSDSVYEWPLKGKLRRPPTVTFNPTEDSFDFGMRRRRKLKYSNSESDSEPKSVDDNIDFVKRRGRRMEYGRRLQENGDDDGFESLNGYNSNASDQANTDIRHKNPPVPESVPVSSSTKSEKGDLPETKETSNADAKDTKASIETTDHKLNRQETEPESALPTDSGEQTIETDIDYCRNWLDDRESTPAVDKVDAKRTAESFRNSWVQEMILDPERKTSEPKVVPTTSQLGIKKERKEWVSTSSEGENDDNTSAPSVGFNSHLTASDWVGQTTNSEECSYSSDMSDSECEDDCEEWNRARGWRWSDSAWKPRSMINPDKELRNDVWCNLWQRDELMRAELSVVDISWVVVAGAEKALRNGGGALYLYAVVPLATLLASVIPVVRLSASEVSPEDQNEPPTNSNIWFSPYALYAQAEELFIGAFGNTQWEISINVTSCVLRFALSILVFFLLAVAERAFKQRFLYAKLFSHLTSSRRARKSNLPHFRLNKVRNIKVWLSVRSYLRRRGPQRSVDVIVSAAFIMTMMLLAFLSLEFLRETVTVNHSVALEASAWCLCLGVYLLRFMTLGTSTNRKYRGCTSALITEQMNLHLAMEQRPANKEELQVANNVLKLAADLLKELESPFKISGMSANPYLYNITKVVILSALSGVLSEMLGFKLKLHKIKIK